MCFSATASFSASIPLAILGVLSIRKVTAKGELLFASIPLLFSVQQFIEGVLWILLRGEETHLQHVLIQTYSVFVGVVWPLVPSLSIMLIEREAWRKKAMLAILAVGAYIAVFTTSSLYQLPVTARIADNCIAYEYPLPQPHFLLALYVIATCGAFFISGNNIIRKIGIVNLIAFFVSYYFYSYDLASVWCFFAAVISGLVCLYFNRNSLSKSSFYSSKTTKTTP